MDTTYEKAKKNIKKVADILDVKCSDVILAYAKIVDMDYRIALRNTHRFRNKMKELVKRSNLLKVINPYFSSQIDLAIYKTLAKYQDDLADEKHLESLLYMIKELL